MQKNCIKSSVRAEDWPFTMSCLRLHEKTQTGLAFPDRSFVCSAVSNRKPHSDGSSLLVPGPSPMWLLPVSKNGNPGPAKKIRRYRGDLQLNLTRCWTTLRKGSSRHASSRGEVLSVVYQLRRGTWKGIIPTCHEYKPKTVIVPTVRKLYFAWMRWITSLGNFLRYGKFLRKQKNG
jgi:hypothetical protein